jgi:hypothetical protein
VNAHERYENEQLQFLLYCNVIDEELKICYSYILEETIMNQKAVHFLLCVFIILLGFSPSSCLVTEQITNETNRAQNHAILQPTRLKKLTTDGGTHIIEKNSGNEVRLRGIVFLGGVGQHPFGKPGDVKYQTTEWDFKNIKSWGVNVILFYMDYHWFTTEQGYTHIEEIFSWSRKYDIYIIPILNVLPIGGHRGGLKFFASKEARKQVREFWNNFVVRYKDRVEIGGYGILDEPHSGGQSIYDPGFKEDLKQYMESLIDDIRVIDQVTPIYIGTVYGSPYGFVRIDDAKQHIVYNIHFYEPMAYTHILYPLLSAGGVTADVTYPGEYVYQVINDYNNPQQIVNWPHVVAGTSSGWKEYVVETVVPEVSIFERNLPPGVTRKSYMAFLNIFCNGDRNAVIYFDHFQYAFDNGDFRPVANGSFEEAFDWDEKAPLIWMKYLNNTGTAERTDSQAYDGTHSVKFSHCSGWSHYENMDNWIATAGAIDVSAHMGKRLKIKFYVKTINATKGLNGIQIKWATACKDYLDKTKLHNLIDELIIKRRDTLHKPFFIGEFTPLLPALRPDRLDFLHDEIAYFELNNLHWTYYVYRENLVNPKRRFLGIYNGPIGVTADNCFKDTATLNVITSFYPRN